MCMHQVPLTMSNKAGGRRPHTFPRHIQMEPTLHLSPYVRGDMRISVETSTSKTITVDIEASDAIYTVEARRWTTVALLEHIRKEAKLHCCSARAATRKRSCRCRQPEDGYTLSDHNIRKESMCHVELRLCGDTPTFV